MNTPESPSQPLFTPWRLALVSQILFAVFALMVSSAALPPRLFNPAWQSSLIGSLLTYALYPLIGLGLLHLAADLDPEDERLGSRRQLYARLAAPVSLAFLLLIPLQVSSQIQQIRGSQTSYTAQVLRQEKLVSELGLLVNRSRSPAEIFQGLTRLQAPAPPQIYQSLSLDDLRSRMRRDLVEARKQLGQLRAGAPKPELRPVIGLIGRNSLLSLAFALGFAGLAQRRRSPVPLLDEWQMGLAKLIVRFQVPHKTSARSAEGRIANYIEELSGAEDQNRIHQNPKNR